MKEQVNHPEHYNKGNIECIDAMLSAKGILKTLAFCECSVFKYNWRQGNKDNVKQEIKKQIWYNQKQNDLISDKLEKAFVENNKAYKTYKKIIELSNKLDNMLQL